LAEVLGWLHRAAQTGLLHYHHQDHEKWIWLHRGEVLFAASNQRMDRLGHSLVRAGLLSFERMREAERHHPAAGRFGKILVERGLLTPHQLWTALQRQVEEIVHSLFAPPAGWLCFWEGEMQPDNVVRLSIPTRRLVQDGIRWREDLRCFVRSLADARIRLERASTTARGLAGIEASVFDALADEPHFVALSRRLRLDVWTVARVVQLLQRDGSVRIRHVEDDPDRTQRVLQSDPADRLRVYVHETVERLGELGAAIAVVDGMDRFSERFGGLIEEVAERFPGLLAGVRPGPGALLDSELLIERAVALPAERQGDVREALGALVDYLEFEVKNHPNVERPDQVLNRPQRCALRSGRETSD
jgi:hypothetical protein